MLSCCIIAADEEGCIGRAIESARELADEVIVVDTGSGDATPVAARSAGARVFDVDWDNDFSEARNSSLERARGEWILMTDLY